MHQMVISGQRSDPTGLWGTFPILLMETCPNDWFVSNTACVSGFFFFLLLLLSFVCKHCARERGREKKCSNFSGEGCTLKCDWPLLCSDCEEGRRESASEWGKQLYRIKTGTRAAGFFRLN